MIELGHTIDRPQLFWDAFRKCWRRHLGSWPTIASGKIGKVRTDAWTELIKRAAEDACKAYAAQLDRVISLGRERVGRIDVYAHDRDTCRLVIAFESELARWNYNGSSGKDWREEFEKLCDIDAELRVLSSTFKCGTGPGFQAFLMDCLRSMRAHFDNNTPGDFLLIFGPEWTTRDTKQPWLAYSLERDFSLRELASAVPLLPCGVIDGHEPADEDAMLATDQ